MTRLLLTCNPGTEDIVLQEAREKLAASPLEVREMHGRLLVETPIDDGTLIAEKVYEMRTIHYAGILLASGLVSPENHGLEEIRKIVREAEPAKYLTGYSAYAVRSVREGSHAFTSMDISRVVGDEVGRILSENGIKPVVRLNSPTHVFRADLIGEKFYLSLSLTGDQSRHIKALRMFEHPAALKTSLAAVMLRIAEYRDGETLIDPMCGSGTIPLEAAFTTVQGPIYCNDKSPRHIASARKNAMAAGVGWRIKFSVSDAVELLAKEGNYDLIISNPPYGIRLGDPRTVRRLYERFAEAASNALSSNGRIVLITTEHKTLKKVAPKTRLRIVNERTVRHGDLWVRILTLDVA